jgi:hypothetical protein
LCVDRRGVYDPIIVLFVPENVESQPLTFKVYHIELERLIKVPGDGGGVIGVSDNRYHPHSPAWFSDKLASVASFVDLSLFELVDNLLSSDLSRRAGAYLSLVDYFGAEAFDPGPLTVSERRVQELSEILKSQEQESKSWHDGHSFSYCSLS